jgi:hypothetical protein
MKTANYRVTSLDCIENVYDAILTHFPGRYIFTLKDGREIIYGDMTIVKIETIIKEHQVSDGPIIVSNDKFKQFSQAVEEYDAWKNGELDGGDDFEPAS